MLILQRKSRVHEPNESPHLPSALEAVLTLSVYNRLSWGSALNRSSQHAVLSSETIGDFVETIPCSSNETPAEDTDAGGEIVRYCSVGMPPQRGSVVCIEGTAYGDGLSERDYAVYVIILSTTTPFLSFSLFVFWSIWPFNHMLLLCRKLDEQMQKLPQKKRRPVQRGPSMHDVRFADLTLRINQPYWLMHQGSCEHFLVIDEIR